MKVLLPVEYWPVSITIGRAEKSASVSSGEKKWGKLKSFSMGSSFSWRWHRWLGFLETTNRIFPIVWLKPSFGWLKSHPFW